VGAETRQDRRGQPREGDDGPNDEGGAWSSPSLGRLDALRLASTAVRGYVATD
jgi:hypothetical protein